MSLICCFHTSSQKFQEILELIPRIPATITFPYFVIFLPGSFDVCQMGHLWRYFRRCVLYPWYQGIPGLAVKEVDKIFLYFPDIRYTPGCAPSVLITFINMILAGEEQPTSDCDPYMYPGQFILQKVFFGLAILCVPVMLFGKPLLFLFRKKRQERRIVVSKQY